MKVLSIISLIAGVVACAVTPVSCSPEGYGAGNGKKVYADYHGVRYTREHDGKNGRWEMYAGTERSSTGRRTLCYNADIVDSTGRHDIAAVAYPLVGMQSSLDRDYIEYQILSAKAAGIDGFFIEWGFFPHENDVLLRAMQKVASEYDFEIGVNWCDGWLYYDWITRLYPEVCTREAKTEYMTRCYQYLVDSVFSVSTAPTVKDRPVFYHFGPGATIDEYRRVLSSLALPEGMSVPVALRRWADWGTLENGRYVPVTGSADIDAWKSVGEIPTAWIPARVRERDAEHPYWDNYAITDDLIEFMKPFRDSIWMSSDPAYMVKSGFAVPGMDNRGCAGWGRGHFFCIPREDGAAYEEMWRFCMESKDSLDMMFIASWSDYTEGHEIEPTVENGYRELRTTLRYASVFKGVAYDESGLELPFRLFCLRKDVKYLMSCVRDRAECSSEKPDVSAGHEMAAPSCRIADAVNAAVALLDNAALDISRGRYSKAKRGLDRAAGKIAALKGLVREETVVVEGLDRQVYIDDALAAELGRHHYTGYISFDYLDAGQEFLFVRSATDRKPEDLFSVVGKVRTDGTGEWKHARIRLYDNNIAYRSGEPAFRFSGNVEVRNITVEYGVLYPVDL